MDEMYTIDQLLRPKKKPLKIFSFNDFIEVVRNTYNMINGDNWGNFVHDNPIQEAVELRTPIITYKIKEKTPAKLGDRYQIKPGIRTAGLDQNTQRVKTTYAQRFLYNVEFGVWEQNWESALEQGEKFEDFMLTYTGLFKELGVSELIYAGATEETAKASWKADIVCYSTFYHVYIERHIPVLNKTIDSIQVTLLGGEKTNG